MPYPPKKESSVFPTPVGVFPFFFARTEKPASLPHARGGVSSRPRHRTARRRSSPRPWGCFLALVSAAFSTFVFPTPVGVFPCPSATWQWRIRLPHARGGVSFEQDEIGIFNVSPPRPWGCFSKKARSSPVQSVFPTPVGVFLAWNMENHSRAGLPHARGGVSQTRPHKIA